LAAAAACSTAAWGMAGLQGGCPSHTSNTTCGAAGVRGLSSWRDARSEGRSPRHECGQSLRQTRRFLWHAHACQQTAEQICSVACDGGTTMHACSTAAGPLTTTHQPKPITCLWLPKCWFQAAKA
jgi:hypothetical protein